MIFDNLETVIDQYYKKRSSLFTKLIGPRVIDALLFMPFSTIEKVEVKEINNTLLNKIIIINVTIDKINFAKSGPITVLCHLNLTDIEIHFFNYKPIYLKSKFILGRNVKIVGKLTLSKSGRYQMINPTTATFKTKPGIYNIYPLTNGLTQEAIYSVINNAFHVLQNQNLNEWLPLNILEKYNFYSFSSSLRNIHIPNSSNIYRERLCFDELLAEQLTIKINNAQRSHGVKIINNKALPNELIRNLPFDLTNSQIDALNSIYQDMGKDQPMNRLLQGDVGSGKTIIAILAMLYAIDSNFQCALLAPTEMLAQQHFNTLQNLLNNGNEIELLTGSTKKKKNILDNIQNGVIQIIVGTHALFNSKLTFKNLGLVIIDEQHRFGVNQRLFIINKGISPHVLSMTATPIPRTIVMLMHGNIDVSFIRDKPKGRKPIITTSLIIDRLQELVNSISGILNKGEQVYWICPLIEDSDKLDYTCVIERTTFLKQYFPTQVDMLHGKMTSTEKQTVFDKFKNGTIKILVSTTVIEVGIDVPQATVIIIENAERFGLAQLHQLRGRVGRNNLQSYCILLHNKNCSKQRINIMKSTNDGFIIAEHDLKLRGGGEILGIKQSGIKKYKTFNLENYNDQVMASNFLLDASELANTIIKTGTISMYLDLLKIFKPDFSINLTRSF